jgi:peptidoglycan hydrolase-like protein with peptidoglycan-binding domain
MKKMLLALSAASLLITAPAMAAPPAAPAAPAATSQTTMRTPTNAASSSSASRAQPARRPSLYVRVQQKLKADNLYNGVINGRRNEATIQAIRAFQRQNHLTVNGRLDAATQRALGV